LVELALALKIQAQIVERVLHGVVHRAFAEFLKGQIKLSLALKRKSQHLVGFNFAGFHQLLAFFRREKFLGDDHHVSQGQKEERINQLDPKPVPDKEESGGRHRQNRKRQRGREARSGFHARQNERDEKSDEDQASQLGRKRPGRTDDEVMS